MNEQSSQSNPAEARVTNFEANIRVDFEAKRIEATVNYSVLVVSSATKELRLDTNKLDIHRVSVTGNPVEFTLDPEVRRSDGRASLSRLEVFEPLRTFSCTDAHALCRSSPSGALCESP